MAQILRCTGKIPEEEVATAANLAGLATTGSIRFVLQQPTYNYLYHLSTDSVVAPAPTPRALLLALWPTVSCGAPRPTIIDRLLYAQLSDHVRP
jgi:hypothetical protein